MTLKKLTGAEIRQTFEQEAERLPPIPPSVVFEQIMIPVTASDSGGLIAAGKVTRVVVDRTKFMSKCCTAG